jgi:DNA-binding beta-propeller fold protein YncE
LLFQSRREHPAIGHQKRASRANGRTSLGIQSGIHGLVRPLAAVVAATALLAGPAIAQQQNGGLPAFVVDPSWPKVPERYKLGDISSIAIDAQDNAYVLHRPRTLKPEEAGKAAPAVMVFDPAGNFIKAWGGPGEGFEWPEREHGIHIDHKGFVWIGGNQCPSSGIRGLKQVADDQLLKFTLDGKFVLQIGKSNQSKGDADTANVHRAADAWVLPRSNEIFVADGYGNHRVIVFDADTGAFKRTWGAFGKPPGGKDNCAIARLTEFPAGGGAPDFNVAHSIRVSNDGTVYLADRENRRLQMFSADGQFVKQLRQTAGPFAANLAFSPDAEQRFLYVGAGKSIRIVDRKSLEVLGQVQVEQQLGGGHHIATDSKGNLYIAATANGMQRLLFKAP